MPSPIPPSATRLCDLPLPTIYDLLAPVTVHPEAPRGTFTNWGRSFTCTPLSVFEPEDEFQCELILELARREGKTVRVAGTGHSPSDLVCTSGYMLRAEKLDKVLEVNVEKRYVVAQAGITLHALHTVLDAHGLAMSNLGSISAQTLGGIVSTATHGSGINYPILSMYVRALVVLLADGSRLRCSREENSDLFMASVCGIGSTGLILEVTIDVEPAFRLKEIQETHSFDDVVRNLDTYANSGQHVRMWWYPQTGTVRTSAPSRTHEAKKHIGNWVWNSLVGYHFLQFLLFVTIYVTPLTYWVGRFAAWLAGSQRTVAVDESHRIFNVNCKYPQYTSEWAISYDRTQACLRELRAWLDEEFSGPSGLRPHFPLEIRFSAADDIWMSPSNGQRTCWLGIIQYKPYGLNVPYRKLFTRFEEIVMRHGGRPHWAKTHPLRPEDLRRLYPRFDAFVAVLNDVDPHGMFRNPYVERHVFGKQGPEFGQRVFKRLR